MTNLEARKAGWARASSKDYSDPEGMYVWQQNDSFQSLPNLTAEYDMLYGKIKDLRKRLYNRDLGVLVVLAIATWTWALVEAFR